MALHRQARPVRQQVLEHEQPWVSRKAKQALGENTNRRNNALHQGSHGWLGGLLALTGEIMKTLFEKGVLA
jgi:hypothetical protein